MTPVTIASDIVADEIGALSKANDILGLAAIIRQAVADDPRVLAVPEVKAWCASRWRFLFLREAVEDPVALEAASVRSDQRSPRQRIAERFLAENIDAWKDEQPDPVERYVTKTALLVCPGLLNGLLPVREFSDDLPKVEWRYRMRVLRAASHPARGCEANVADIMRALNEGKGHDAAAKPILDASARAPGDVMILAYSKGAPDTLTTLIEHPEIKDRVRCIFTWAGAIGGSQVADGVERKFKATGQDVHAAKISSALKGFAKTFLSKDAISSHRLDEYDTVAAVRDLTTGVRGAFLAQHGPTIDQLNIPIFTLRGVTSLAEVPWSQRGGCKLLSGVEAQHDMQVPGSCSKLPLPMATELAVLHGHHWDLAYPSFRKRRWLNNTYHPFPKTAAVTAMVQLASELGLVR
ncbi:MAG: hypothetical protein ABL901_17105 [Hyphomicrobiaceae bacterium]